MARFNNLFGFLNINKAGGMTAHDVVARVRKLTGMKQVGHAGTLDPMATGVLPVALGRACRLLRFLDDDKTYDATILFGVKTDTDDVEGKIIAKSDRIPDLQEIEQALEKFLGEIEQVPPLYSAIHVGGERLYKLARRGENPVEVPKRKVKIYSIERLDYRVGNGNPSRYPNAYLEGGDSKVDSSDLDLGKGTRWAELDIRIHCGSGTYIRSIARDLGDELSSAACLSALKRVQAGGFSIAKSISLDDLTDASSKNKIADLLLAPESVLKLPKINLGEEDLIKRLGWGQTIRIEADASLSKSVNAFPSKDLDEKAKPWERQLPAGSHESAPEFIHILFQGKSIAICRPLKFESKQESYIVELRPEVVLVDGSSN